MQEDSENNFSVALRSSGRSVYVAGCGPFSSIRSVLRKERGGKKKKKKKKKNKHIDDCQNRQETK